MSPELLITFIVLFVLLVAGGIVLINTGSSRKRIGLVRSGWMLIAIAAVLSLVLAGHFAFGVSFMLILLFFLIPTAIIGGLVSLLVFSITLIVKGFTRNRPTMTAFGFILLFFDIALIVVPVVIISIFGLPISLM